MTESVQNSTTEIAGVATVEPDRIELMVREAVERKFSRFEVHSVDIRLDQERASLQTLAQGRACVHVYCNNDFTELKGTFQLTGYRSSHTPLGLDNLELSFELGEVA